MASLQDQLLKAGVVDKKKANKIKKEKHKQAKQQPKNQPQTNEAKELARQAIADKAARDKAMNAQKQAEAERKALKAQILQLIAMNRIDRGKGDTAFQFTDGSKIKKIYVDGKLHRQLGAGVIAIVKVGENFELVPAGVADKIRQRDENYVVLHNTRDDSQVDEDDPYAEFQIPDDLMW